MQKKKLVFSGIEKNFAIFEMKKTKNQLMMADDKIINKIYLIRGKKVMLDRDLAELYGVET